MPTTGQTYTAGQTLGNATVLFAGSSTYFHNTLNVVNGTTYYYALYAYDTSLNYSTVASTSATPHATDTTPPGPVTNLQPTPLDSEVDLTWTNPSASDLAGVLIVRGTGVTPNTAPTTGQTYTAGQTLGNATVLFAGSSTYFHNTLNVVNGTTYYYALYAYDTSLNYSTVASTSATPHATDTTPPGPVTNLQPTPLDSEVDLTWTNPSASDLAGVLIVRGTGVTPNTAPTTGQTSPLVKRWATRRCSSPAVARTSTTRSTWSTGRPTTTPCTPTTRRSTTRPWPAPAPRRTRRTRLRRVR